MANLLINAGAGIASVAIPLGQLSQQPGPEATTVQIGIGGAPNAGGSVPHVALWGEDGGRIGQYHGDANGHIDAETVKVITIDNEQNGKKAKQAEYLMLAMNESDAICISMIMVSGDGAEWTWVGDMGKTCGADWYPSNFKIGDSTQTPACVWISQNNKGGKIRAQGLSLHMPDFAGDDGKAGEYQNNQDALCKSSKRMTFWPSIVADAVIPTFQPPLKYNADGTDVDVKKVIDRKTALYPRSKREVAKSRITKRGDRNNQPGHLVVSHNPRHSAKEVCEHPNSLGPDFVSTVEGVYCDMSMGEWWSLCSATVTDGCFDLEKKAMRGHAQGHKGARDVAPEQSVPDKTYNTAETWNL